MSPPPPPLAGSIKESPSTSGFHRKLKLVLSAYYITNSACRFLLLRTREVCVVVLIDDSGARLRGLLISGLVWCLFLFSGQEQKVSGRHAIRKSHDGRMKHQLNGRAVGPGLRPRGPAPHQAVGEKGVPLKEPCAATPGCSEASSAAGSRKVQGCLLSSLQQGTRAGWPFPTLPPLVRRLPVEPA